jgi:hypothetical protein
MMAFVSGGPPQPLLRDRFLFTAPNALQQQALPAAGPVSRNEPWSLEDISGLSAKGNADAWGMATFDTQATPAPTLKGAGSFARLTPALRQGILAMTTPNPVVMVHNLNKVFRRPDGTISPTPTRPITENDVHPYEYQGWRLIFNGSIGALHREDSAAAIAHLYNLPAQSFASLLKREQVIAVILARATQRAQEHVPTWPTETSINTPSAADYRGALGDVVRFYVAASSPDLKHVNPTHNPFNLAGKVQTGPSPNIIMSNGNLTMAVKVNRSLYLGAVRPDAQPQSPITEYVLASEIPEPDPRVTWLDIPERHIVSLERLSNGTVQAEISPL